MPSPRTVEQFAPAKINLALHITGRRSDGYHLLDSLVAFAGVGDRLTAREASTTSFEVTGPCRAGVPRDAQNLVLRAARLYAPPVSAALVLDKRLPAASGIGGGSADAAACLHALSALSGRPTPAVEAQLRIGADVPVCVVGRPARMSGIGEQIAPLEQFPDVWAVLVNPGVAVSTAVVFSGLGRADNAPMPDSMPTWRDAASLADWLSHQRNDLELPAVTVAPQIRNCLSAVGSTGGCLIARMSGSGATCFGLYAGRDQAERAAEQLQRKQPDWWCEATLLRRG